MDVSGFVFAKKTFDFINGDYFELVSYFDGKSGFIDFLSGCKHAFYLLEIE